MNDVEGGDGGGWIYHRGTHVGEGMVDELNQLLLLLLVVVVVGLGLKLVLQVLDCGVGDIGHVVFLVNVFVVFSVATVAVFGGGR